MTAHHNSDAALGGGEAKASLLGVPGQVYAIAMVRFCDALGNSFLWAVLPLFFGDFHDPSLQVPEELLVGLLLTVYGFAGALLQPLVGWLSDRTGHRKAFAVAGLGILAAATYGFTLASGFADLLALRCLQGLGVALTVPTSFALISGYTSRANRGAAMAVFTTARHAGFVVGPLLGGLLFAAFGYYATFAAAAALILLGTALFALVVSEPERSRPAELPPARRHTFGALFARGGLPILGLISVVTASIVSLLGPLEKQINARLEQGAAEFGVAISTILFINILFQIPMGRLGDRIGRKPVMAAGLFLLCPAVIAAGFAGSTLQLIAILALQGLAISAVAPTSYALAADLAPRGAEAKQISVLTAAFGLGLGLGPLLTGWLAGYFFYELPFCVAAALAALTLALVLARVAEPGRGRSESADGPPGAPDLAKRDAMM